MSGRVNTKFVIGLSATLIAIIIGLAGVWYMFVRTDPAEYIARADAMLVQGHYIKAVEYYRKARSGRPHDPQLMLKQAQALSQITVQDTRRARAAIGQLIDLYKSVLEVDSRQQEAMQELAGIYMKIGRELNDLDAWGQLLSITNTATLSDPENLTARKYRGIAQVNRMFSLDISDEEGQTALNDLKQVNAEDPSDPQVLHHIALWHALQYTKLKVRAGYTKQALQHQKQALELADTLLAQFNGGLHVTMYKLRLLTEMKLFKQADVLVLDLEKRLSTTTSSPDIVLEVARYIASRASAKKHNEQQRIVDLTRASNLVSQVVAAHPEDLRLVLLQGQIFTAMGEFDQAVKVLYQAISQELKALPLVAYQSAQLRRAASIQHADLSLRIADQQTGDQRVSDLADVEKLIETLRLEVGDNAYVTMLKGKLDLSRHHWGLALKELDTASSMFNGRKLDVLLLSASACVQLGELGAAIQRLESLLKVRSDYIPARIELAKLQLRLSNPQKAIKQINAVLRIDPAMSSDKQFGQLLAIYYAQTEQVDQAMAIYQKLDPENDVQVALSLARLQVSVNQKSQAITLLTKHFQKNPKNVAVLRELVQTIDHVQQLKPYFAQAKAAGVEDNALLLLKSKLVDKTGKSTAYAVAQIVGEIDDPFQRAMSQYMLNRKLGKNDLAQLNLQEAARLNPDHSRVIAAQFIYAIVHKDWLVASELVDLAKKNNTDLANGNLFAGRLELAKGQIQSAVSLLGQGIKQRSVYSEGWRWLAEAQRASGDLVAAENSYEQSIRQSPTNIRAYEGLAQTYDMAGNRSKAVTTWRNLYQIAPENRIYRDKYLAYEQRKGDSSKALKVRERIAQEDPEDMGNQRGLAVLYAHLRRMEDAKGLMQKLFAKAPMDRANYGAYAAVLSINEQLDQARIVMDDFLKQLGDQAVVDDYLLGARFLLSVDDKAGAYKRYTQAVACDQTKDMQASREWADALFNDQRFSEAAPIYQTIWDTDRQDGRVGYRLVETLERNKKFDQANRVLEDLESVIGKSATSLMLKSQIAHHQGQKNQAVRLLDQAIDLVPEDAMVYYQRASLLLADLDQESQVIKDLRKVLELAPNFTAAHRMLAQIHLRHDSLDQAVAAYESVLSQNPDDMTTRLDLLQMYINANDILAAKTLLTKSSQRFASEARWPKLQADLAIRSKNHRQAARYLLAAFELEPNSKVLAAMGLEMIHAGAAGMAIEKIEQNKPLLDSSVQVQAILGRAKYKLKQKSQGQQIIKQALLQAQTLQELLVVSDQLLVSEGLIGTQKLLQSLKGTKSDIWIEIAMARGEVSATKYEQASNRLKRIKTKVSDKEKSEFRGLLSLALHNCGKFEEASDIYQQVLLEDPNNFTALNNLAYLLATNLNKPAEALQYAKSAASQNPNDPQVLDTLGWVQFLAGHHKDAEMTLRRSVRIKPFSANTYHLAEVMIKDGQTRYATQLLDMARQFARKNADKKMLDKVNVRLKEVTQ